jgi:hypothetical protein
MARRRNALFDTALAYVSVGASVVPAFPLVRTERRRRTVGLRRRRDWTCACGDAACDRPGAHALLRDGKPLGGRTAVEAAWAGVEPAPSVMAVPGTAFDIWRIPAVVGAAGLRELEHQRLPIWPPTVRTPDGRWLMVTAPVDPTWRAEWPGYGVRRIEPTTPVLVPPSRTPDGVLHWMWSRRFPRTPLPSADMVLAALVIAAGRLS